MFSYDPWFVIYRFVSFVHSPHDFSHGLIRRTLCKLGLMMLIKYELRIPYHYPYD